jgi:hypothetical protein
MMRAKLVSMRRLSRTFLYLDWIKKLDPLQNAVGNIEAAGGLIYIAAHGEKKFPSELDMLPQVSSKFPSSS